MMENILDALFWIGFFCLGIICLSRPHAVQKFINRSHSTDNINPFANYTRSPEYIIHLKVWGIFAMLMSAFVLFLIVFGKKH